MIYNDGSTSTLYYYVLNAQGDVIALLNSAGALVASYSYGAWGNYSVHDKDGKKTTDANRMTPRRGSSARACTTSSTPTPASMVTEMRGDRYESQYQL